MRWVGNRGQRGQRGWGGSQFGWTETPVSPPPQEFFYAGPREELAQKVLLVSVWDYDLGTADDFIGEERGGVPETQTVVISGGWGMIPGTL